MKNVRYFFVFASFAILTNHAVQATKRWRSSMQLTSSAFSHEQPIPKKFSGEGQNVSPALQWDNVPQGTQSFALIVTDPDAPIANPPWVHWTVYNIPPSVTELSEGVNPSSIGARAGITNFGTTKYGGPKPPPGHGPHRYYFTLYALDSKLDHLPPGTAYQDILNAMIGHVIEEVALMGTYERK